MATVEDRYRVTRMVIAPARRLMRLTSLFVLAIATTSACATEATDGLDTDDVEAAADDGKVDSASELSVRVSETTLWITRSLERRGNLFVVRGRTSRNLTDGNAFVFDDPYGDFLQRTARTFEVTFDASTAHTMVDGVNLFTSLSFVHSSSRPDHLTARVTVRPRLASTTGPSSLALTAELTPIVVAGHTVYRVTGRSTKAITAVSSTLGDARLVDANHYTVDLDFDQLMIVATPGGEFSVTAALPAGPATIRASLGMVIKKLGLTSQDIEVVYPVPSCTTTIRSCLTALPDGALDLAACGEAINVRVCQGQLGVVVDAPAIAVAKTASDAKLSALATDAVGLVGAARATALTAAAREVIAGRLAAEQGVWLLGTTARTAVLARATEVPLDDAYAYPLAFVDGLEPAPGDVAATRQVAADAVLGYLRTQDYLHSALGRSYLELTRELRTQHVGSLRAFRQTSALMTLPSMPNVDYYVGEWLGMHTEVNVDHTTGVPIHVLVELD